MGGGLCSGRAGLGHGVSIIECMVVCSRRGQGGAQPGWLMQVSLLAACVLLSCHAVSSSITACQCSRKQLPPSVMEGRQAQQGSLRLGGDQGWVDPHRTVPCES